MVIHRGASGGRAGGRTYGVKAEAGRCKDAVTAADKGEFMSRRIVFSGLVAGIVLCTAAPAWAHVTISPATAEKGASDVEIAFRVPNEEATASTTKLQVAIPTDPPLLGVLAQSVPGWTAAVVTTHLPKPIHTDDGDVTDAVSEVTWTADANGGIPPADFGKFEILVGSLPSTGDQIVFKAIQTYSNGAVVKWIDPVTPNGPPADHPTPILQLTAPGATATATTTPTTAVTATASGSVKTAQDDANTAKTIGIVAIILAVIALAAVAFSMFRKRASVNPVDNVH
jgi:uncharacterized protein YcnI